MLVEETELEPVGEVVLAALAVLASEAAQVTVCQHLLVLDQA